MRFHLINLDFLSDHDLTFVTLNINSSCEQIQKTKVVYLVYSPMSLGHYGPISFLSIFMLELAYIIAVIIDMKINKTRGLLLSLKSIDFHCSEVRPRL